MPACEACGRENRDEARYCAQCGRTLARSCPRCRAALLPGARFCDQCGTGTGDASPTRSTDPASYTPAHLAERILRTRSALEGEHKQVTVLFADVKDSLELSRRLDVEAWHGVMEQLFEILTDGVHRYEGTINQYTGDGIMALFGAPVAHEDHAQRACFSALWLRDRVRRFSDELRLGRGIDLALRMGLNSGGVIVGRIGPDLRMDYTAQGETVGLAARVESICAPNAVYLSRSTADLVEGYFELENLGPAEFRGMEAPSEVFELVRARPGRTRFDRSRTRGLTRFVGRAGEIGVLEGALSEARAGRGTTVVVVGEPGAGKSRLCFEFLERCRADGLDVWSTGAPAHGRLVPHLPTVELLRAQFGLDDADSDRRARERIAGRLLLIDHALRDELPLVFDFLGVSDPARPAPRLDADAHQRRLTALLRRVLVEADAATPTLTLVEDLHWIDPASEAWLATWIAAVPRTAHLLLLNTRPEYDLAAIGAESSRRIDLRPLGPDDMRELIEDLLGRDPELRGLADEIRTRSGGNPYFAEEIVQWLLESGRIGGTRGRYHAKGSIGRLAVPPTLEAMLASRVDRLSERDKQVLQRAAVIGRAFPHDILAEVVDLAPDPLDAALAQLVRSSLIDEDTPYPDREYSFRHPLLHEVARGLQLSGARAGIHRRIAQAYESLYAERLDSRAALLADHWERAEEPLEAARWSARAAERETARDVDGALRHWNRVRALLVGIESTPQSRALGIAACRGILNAGWRLGDSEEVESVFDEGLALARESEDVGALATLHSLYGNAKGLGSGDPLLYLEHATRAVEIARDGDDAGLLFCMESDQAIPLAYQGRLAEAERQLAQPTAGVPDVGHRVFGFGAHLFQAVFRGWVQVWRGQLGEARATLERALGRARREDEMDHVYLARLFHVSLAYREGNAARAMAHAPALLELCRQTGGALRRLEAHQNLATALLLQGQHAQALEAAEASLLLSRETGAGRMLETETLRIMAEAHLGRGEHRLALVRAEEAVAAAEQRHMRLYEPDARLVRARARLRLEGADGLEAAGRDVERARAWIAESGAGAVAPLSIEVEAEWSEVSGRSEQAADLRDRARAAWLAIGAGSRSAALGER